MNKYFNILLIIAFIIVLVCVYLKNKALQDEISYWQNQAIKKDSLIQIDSVNYEIISKERNRLISENNKLLLLAKQNKEEIVYLLNLKAKYELALSNIHTKPADTVVIFDKPDSLARIFSVEVDSTLKISGAFQTHEPYYISFSEILFRAALNIILSQDKYGYWHTRISTNSPYLKLEEARVQVLSRDDNWRFFYGGGFSLFERSLGIGGLFGVRKRDYGGSLSFTYQQHDGRLLPLWFVTLYKFM